MGLIIPDGEITMSVGYEEVRWEEGKVIAFDDTFIHQASWLQDVPLVALCCSLSQLHWMSQVPNSALLDADITVARRKRNVIRSFIRFIDSFLLDSPIPANRYSLLITN